MKRHIPAPLRQMVKIYFEKRISRSAAAFAFFFTLSLFPLLIILSMMLGSLHIEAASLAGLLQGVVPEETLKTLLDYLNNVYGNGGEALLAAGFAAVVATSASAFRVVQTAMTDIFGAARFRILWGTLFSFVFAVLFLGVIYLSLLIVVTGSWLMQWVARILGLEQLGFFWNWFRFVLLFLLLTVVLYGIYRLTAPPEKPRRQRIIGALAAAGALVLCSIVFSTFIGLSTRYSLIYGSLASVVILMLWLYLCGNVLLLGNVLNLVVNQWRAERLTAGGTGGKGLKK